MRCDWASAIFLEGEDGQQLSMRSSARVCVCWASHLPEALIKTVVDSLAFFSSDAGLFVLTWPFFNSDTSLCLGTRKRENTNWPTG